MLLPGNPVLYSLPSTLQVMVCEGGPCRSFTLQSGYLIVHMIQACWMTSLLALLLIGLMRCRLVCLRCLLLLFFLLESPFLRLLQRLSLFLLFLSIRLQHFAIFFLSLRSTRTLVLNSPIHNIPCLCRDRRIKNPLVPR